MESHSVAALRNALQKSMSLGIRSGGAAGVDATESSTDPWTPESPRSKVPPRGVRNRGRTAGGVSGSDGRQSTSASSDGGLAGLLTRIDHQQAAAERWQQGTECGGQISLANPNSTTFPVGGDIAESVIASLGSTHVPGMELPPFPTRTDDMERAGRVLRLFAQAAQSPPPQTSNPAVPSRVADGSSSANPTANVIVLKLLKALYIKHKQLKALRNSAPLPLGPPGGARSMSVTASRQDHRLGSVSHTVSRPPRSAGIVSGRLRTIEEQEGTPNYIEIASSFPDRAHDQSAKTDSPPHIPAQPIKPESSQPSRPSIEGASDMISGDGVLDRSAIFEEVRDLRLCVQDLRMEVQDLLNQTGSIQSSHPLPVPSPESNVSRLIDRTVQTSVTNSFHTDTGGAPVLGVPDTNTGTPYTEISGVVNNQCRLQARPVLLGVVHPPCEHAPQDLPRVKRSLCHGWSHPREADTYLGERQCPGQMPPRMRYAEEDVGGFAVDQIPIVADRPSGFSSPDFAQPLNFESPAEVTQRNMAPVPSLAAYSHSTRDIDVVPTVDSPQSPDFPSFSTAAASAVEDDDTVQGINNLAVSFQYPPEPERLVPPVTISRSPRYDDEPDRAGVADYVRGGSDSHHIARIADEANNDLSQATPSISDSPPRRRGGEFSPESRRHFYAESPSPNGKSSNLDFSATRPAVFTGCPLPRRHRHSSADCHQAAAGGMPASPPVGIAVDPVLHAQVAHSRRGLVNPLIRAPLTAIDEAVQSPLSELQLPQSPGEKSPPPNAVPGFFVLSTTPMMAVRTEVPATESVSQSPTFSSDAPPTEDYTRSGQHGYATHGGLHVEDEDDEAAIDEEESPILAITAPAAQTRPPEVLLEPNNDSGSSQTKSIRYRSAGKSSPSGGTGSCYSYSQSALPPSLPTVSAANGIVAMTLMGGGIGSIRSTPSRSRHQMSSSLHVSSLDDGEVSTQWQMGFSVDGEESPSADLSTSFRTEYLYSEGTNSVAY